MTPSQIVHENVAAVKRFFLEVMNEGRLELIPELFSPSYTLNGRPFPPASTEAWAKQLRDDNPNLHFTLRDIVAQDDKVAVWWILTGLTNPPGKASGINMLHFQPPGRAISNWEGDLAPDIIPDPSGS